MTGQLNPLDIGFFEDDDFVFTQPWTFTDRGGHPREVRRIVLTGVTLIRGTTREDVISSIINPQPPSAAQVFATNISGRRVGRA
jgi:hypothetical protein